MFDPKMLWALARILLLSMFMVANHYSCTMLVSIRAAIDDMRVAELRPSKVQEVWEHVQFQAILVEDRMNERNRMSNRRHNAHGSVEFYCRVEGDGTFLSQRPATFVGRCEPCRLSVSRHLLCRRQSNSMKKLRQPPVPVPQAAASRRSRVTAEVDEAPASTDSLFF